VVNSHWLKENLGTQVAVGSIDTGEERSGRVLRRSLQGPGGQGKEERRQAARRRLGAESGSPMEARAVAAQRLVWGEEQAARNSLAHMGVRKGGGGH
jgi:hypothetical protein